MSFIEHISLKLSKNLGDRLNKNEEEIAVLNYGLFFVLHNAVALIITFFVGALFNVLLEIMLISLSAAMLKRYCGGVHSSTANRCILSGLILSLILSFMSKYFSSTFSYNTMVFFIGASLTISFIVICRKCPVPSKNKPLKKESTRKRLRKKAFNLIYIYGLLIIGMVVLYSISRIQIIKVLMISITMGVLLQVIVMTKLGEYVVNIFEVIFNLINIK